MNKRLKDKAAFITGGGSWIGKAISHLAWFLASGESSFITGQNFVIDGGETIC